MRIPSPTRPKDPPDRAKKDGNAPPGPRATSPKAPQPPRFRVPRGWIVIALALLAFNFVGDSLRDALDPLLKR